MIGVRVEPKLVQLEAKGMGELSLVLVEGVDAPMG